MLSPLKFDKLICAISIICLAVVLVLVLVLKDIFQVLVLVLVLGGQVLVLILVLGVQVLVLVLVVGGQVLVLVLVFGGQVLVLVLVLGSQVLVNIPATSAAANLRDCHMLAVVDAEDAPLTQLIECIHLSSHCLCQCPRLGSIQKDWQDIHGVEANLGRHRDAGAPVVAIQLRHANSAQLLSVVPTLLRSVHFGQSGFQDR